MVAFYEWQDETWLEKTPPIDNLERGVTALLGGADELTRFVGFFDDTLAYVDIERLLLLTNAKVALPAKGAAIEWAEVSNLESFQMEADEFSRRFTYLHENKLDVNRWKSETYLSFLVVDGLIANPATFQAARFEDFRTACRIQLTLPTQNIIGSKGTLGTLAYIGVATLEIARKSLETLVKATDPRSQAQKLIIIAYTKSDGNIDYEYLATEPKINDNTAHGPANIRRSDS